MIFVTVGTHEQQFNRLVRYMDQYAADHEERVVIQAGFSTYEPKYCEWAALYPYQKMVEMVERARIVITHGGPSSFNMPLRIGKTPIVVPRKKEFGEHVNNHQVYFCRQAVQRMENIIFVEDIEKLGDVIEHYDDVKRTEMNISNNARFCEEFESIVNKMFNGKN